MKTTKCVLCGRDFSIAEETVFDQHVLCPYCGGKFSYLADSAEFSVERLAYAIAECRKNEEDAEYYDAAPSGARLYIGLVFYGRVFKDRMNRDLYLAEMAEIEPELKNEDWAYLLEHEDDPELVSYFKSKLPKGTVRREPEKKPTETRTHPKIGILRSPVPAKKSTEQPSVSEPIAKNPEPKTPVEKIKGRRSASAYLVAAAGVCGILIAGLILIRLVSGGSESRPTHSVEVSNDGRREQDELTSAVSKHLAELETRRNAVDKSIKEIRSDKNKFMTELNRAIEQGNIRSAELQTKGCVRLNGAETAMLVLRAPFFNAFAIRYCGDKPFEKAESCRVKVQQAIDSCKEWTPAVAESFNQLAIAYQESAVGEVRRAINDKFQSMTELRKSISETIRILSREQTEILHLKADQGAEKKITLEKLFQGESFTADCGLANVDEQLKAQVQTDDVFSLADRVQRTSASQEAIDNRIVSTSDNPVATETERKNLPTKKADREDLSTKQIAAQEKKKTTKGSVPKQKKPKGRRQKCKSPIKCMNFAEPGHNFCADHECHSYGCKEHVRTANMPNWPIGGLKSVSSLSPAWRERVRGKCLGHFCTKHCCNRICPSIKDYHEWWDGYLNWDNGKTEKFFFCDQERLAKSRYCAEHACPVQTCGSSREEYWKLENGTSNEEQTEKIGPIFWWCQWRNWILVRGPLCRAHGSMDPESVPERDKRTPGDLQREKDESRARN